MKAEDGLIGSFNIPAAKKKTGTTEIVNNTWRVICCFYLRHAIDNLTFTTQCYNEWLRYFDVKHCQQA